MAGTLSLMSPGFAMGLAGTALGAGAASSRRNEFAQSLNEWLPNIPQYTQNYFGDLSKYLPQATALGKQIGQSDLANQMALRDQELPGFTQNMQQASQGIFSLMKGQVTPEMMANFQRAGGASTVGSGFGGSNFGALNTGLFGARGSLGAMQTGFGLLPTLLGAMPSTQSGSPMNFLQNIMTPAQQTTTQLGLRGQNIGIAEHLAGMPSGNDMWGQFLTSTGGEIMGADQSTANSLMSKGMGMI